MKKWPEMSAEDKEAFWALAVKTGRVIVAPDVFEALLQDGPVGASPLLGLALDVVRDEHLPPGAVIAYESSRLSTISTFGPALDPEPSPVKPE